jgi:hypothetical protein
MDRYVVVERIDTNHSDVTFLTKDNSLVLVSVYGSGVGFLSDDTVIGIAKEELKRKIDSDYFCLVSVQLSERRQKQFDFTSPLPSDERDQSSSYTH